MLLNAYGTPVTVNAPADADAYVEQPDGGNDNQDAPSTNGNAGKQDPEVYAIYEAAFDAIESISDYLICITKNGEVELYYTFRATQQYENINLLQEDGTRLWIEYTNGKGYVYDTEGNSGFVETAVDEEFLATLELGRALKELLLALELHGNDMENLSFVNFSRDDLSYSHDRGDGWVDQYHIRLLRTIHGIETVIITVTSFHNGEKCDTIEYYFTEDILIT